MKDNKKLMIAIGITVITVIVLSTILIAIILIETNNKEEKIVLNPKEITESIIQGTTKEIKINASIFLKEDDIIYDTRTVNWSIDNEKVATINGEGESAALILKSEGKAVVTVTYGELTTKCNVTVTELIPHIVLSETTINETLVTGKTKVLTLTATPKYILELENLEDYSKLKWESSNTKVAEVEANSNAANIIIKSIGATTITVSYGNIYASCEIVIVKAVPKITLDKKTVIVNKGDKLTLTATPEHVDENSIKWEIIGDKAIVGGTEISKDKKSYTLKALKGGNITVKVTADGLSSTCKLSVNDVDITKTSLDVNKGKTSTLMLSNYKPAGAITWTSSDAKVATVSAKGVVTGLTGGTVTITAKHNASGLSDTCIVNVKEVNIQQTSENVNKGETIKITLSEHKPSGTIKWASSNIAVAVINSDGTVTAKSGGSATITATHAASGLKDSCTVNVKEVNIEQSSADIYKGATKTLTLNNSYKPSGTTTWTSSDTRIATVDANGKVIGKAGGMATVTATNGKLKDTCQVWVQDIEIIETKVDVNKGSTVAIILTQDAPKRYDNMDK